ncbi:LacI family DNA-binding transcriptional regulator [Ornithinibacillus californiensis]|uniref:LacI family DNA-binding transcriptional regulator n=1 Tax=Ornithinibacillus californiensis TaxID=161536 RepID=UPI00069D6B48|nr:LacI family DNA-binding transcriptional regulator [Ornithinibacillus californiensis]
MSKYTIKDLARETGYSITTISRALNNKKEGVSEETRERILEVARQKNYQPNSFARGLITKKSNLLGLIVPNILNPFFPEICRGAEDEAAQNGYSLIICNSDDQSDKEEKYIRLLKEQQVDGVLLASMNKLTSRSEEFLSASNIPYILMDRGSEDSNSSRVLLDDFQGGYLAGKHLIEMGHHQIACMTGPPDVMNSTKRLKGFLQAMDEHDISVPEYYILNGNYHLEDAYVQAKEFFQKNKATAIFAANDLMACGIYQAIFELGMSIPNDLSVVGFDDIPFAQVLHPKLTTIRQNTYQMGQDSVRLLIKKINKEPVESLLYEPTLVIRESTIPLVRSEQK